MFGQRLPVTSKLPVSGMMAIPIQHIILAINAIRKKTGHVNQANDLPILW